MSCLILSYLFSTLISLMSIGRLSEQEKDLEILLLRHQLAILERKLDKPVKPNRAEKLTLVVLTAAIPVMASSLITATFRLYFGRDEKHWFHRGFKVRRIFNGGSTQVTVRR